MDKYKTPKTFISSMEEHFTTYTYHNHHHYYNIMQYQRFTFNLDLEKKLMEECYLFSGFIQSLWLKAMYIRAP